MGPIREIKGRSRSNPFEPVPLHVPSPMPPEAMPRDRRDREVVVDETIEIPDSLPGSHIIEIDIS